MPESRQGRAVWYYSSIMYNFCTGMLCLMTAGYAGVSAAKGNWIMAVVCLLACAFFYGRLDKSVNKED